MYKRLTEKEIRKFTRKYLNDWIGEINEISCIRYRFTKEYLINEHYLVITKIFKIIHKDLQEI